MEDNKNYENVRTAIVLPTLCRNKHLEKCLDSLMKNPWAKYVDLYIGVDYPAKKSHWPGYREILKLMEDVNQKYGNTVIMVTHNDAIKQMADRVIRLRDGKIRKICGEEEEYGYPDHFRLSGSGEDHFY